MSRAQPRLGVSHPTVVPANAESASEDGSGSETEASDDEAAGKSRGD